METFTSRLACVRTMVEHLVSGLYPWVGRPRLVVERPARALTESLTEKPVRLAVHADPRIPHDGSIHLGSLGGGR